MAAFSPTDILDSLVASLNTTNEALLHVPDEIDALLPPRSRRRPRGNVHVLQLRPGGGTINLVLVSREAAVDSGDPPPPTAEQVAQRKGCFDNLPSYTAPKTTEKGEPCPICLEKHAEGEKITKLLCNHEMHSACAWEWLKGHNTCPVCRFETM